MLKEFKLRGNVSNVIRSDDEMAHINKDDADNAFKEHKKKLDLFLQQNGFVKYKTNSYVRRNDIDVLEYQPAKRAIRIKDIYSKLCIDCVMCTSFLYLIRFRREIRGTDMW